MIRKIEGEKEPSALHASFSEGDSHRMNNAVFKGGARPFRACLIRKSNIVYIFDEQKA